MAKNAPQHVKRRGPGLGHDYIPSSVCLFLEIMIMILYMDRSSVFSMFLLLCAFILMACSYFFNFPCAVVSCCVVLCCVACRSCCCSPASQSSGTGNFETCGGQVHFFVSYLYASTVRRSYHGPTYVPTVQSTSTSTRISSSFDSKEIPDSNNSKSKNNTRLRCINNRIFEFSAPHTLLVNCVSILHLFCTHHCNRQKKAIILIGQSRQTRNESVCGNSYCGSGVECLFVFQQRPQHNILKKAPFIAHSASRDLTCYVITNLARSAHPMGTVRRQAIVLGRW